MKKLQIIALNLGLITVPLIAEVRVSLKNLSDIPITAVTVEKGIFKTKKGDKTLIPVGGTKVLRGSKPFNIEIHAISKKGEDLEFMTTEKIIPNDTLYFPIPSSFKVIKGQFPEYAATKLKSAKNHFGPEQGKTIIQKEIDKILTIQEDNFESKLEALQNAYNYLQKNQQRTEEDITYLEKKFDYLKAKTDEQLKKKVTLSDKIFFLLYPKN